MKLTHVGISNFRSIGEEPVMIDLTKKINVLVGANNCGKSNVLRALGSFGAKTENEIDLHGRIKNSYPAYWVVGSSGDEKDAALKGIGLLKIGRQQTGEGERYLGDPFANMAWGEFEPIWRGFSPGYSYSGRPSERQTLEEKTKTTTQLWQKLKDDLPKVSLVPQFRQITDAEAYSIDGGGIVRVLWRWQHPPIGSESDRIRFTKVQDLLRSLIQHPEVALEVDHSAQHILVSHGRLRLPLSSYGTGIHELIILAIAVLSHENALVCIEEPEIHLHPLLQRRFLDFLRSDATTNRYVVTTHSPALIAPNDDTAFTHLWLENRVTQSRRIETTHHSLEALRDLGAKASDLLQANSVIWVEGPSDRIYIKRWLELLYPGEFREGIDYSVMFYGGRLLAHVSLGTEQISTDTDDADELVHLLRINQHSAILIDSDRRRKTDPINATKLRVQQECAASKTLCWITDGREIENYLPDEVLNAAYEKICGSKPTIRLSQFESIESALKKGLFKTWRRASYYDHAKPQLARQITPHIAKESISPELKEWIAKLVRVIRHEGD